MANEEYDPFAQLSSSADTDTNAGSSSQEDKPTPATPSSNDPKPTETDDPFHALGQLTHTDEAFTPSSSQDINTPPPSDTNNLLNTEQNTDFAQGDADSGSADPNFGGDDPFSPSTAETNAFFEGFALKDEHLDQFASAGDYYAFHEDEHEDVAGVVEGGSTIVDGVDLMEEEKKDAPDPFQELFAKLQAGREFVDEFKNNVKAIQGLTNPAIPPYETNPEPNTLDSPTTSSAPKDDLESYPVEEKAGKTTSYGQLLERKLFLDKKKREKTTPDVRAEVEEKIKYLEGKIKLDRLKFRGWEKKSKNWALTFRLLSSALAAVVTVLLGINITDSLRDYGVDWFINTIALIISAFISILGVIQGFYDANELYIKYTDTANKLEQLTSTIGYLKLGMDYVTLDDVNAIYLEYDRIIESTYEYEMRVRTKEQETVNQIQQQGTAS